MSPQLAWLRAAAMRAGFMGRAPMLRPAMPDITPLPDWPPPEDERYIANVSVEDLVPSNPYVILTSWIRIRMHYLEVWNMDPGFLLFCDSFLTFDL